MARLLDTEQALQYVAMRDAKQATRRKPTKTKEDKTGHGKPYRVLLELGNTLPSFRAFVCAQSLFNRATKRYRSEWKINTTMINILFMLDELHYCRQNNMPFATATLMRNYSCSREFVNTFLNYLNQLHALGFITFSYSGKLKGSKVSITAIGSKCVMDIYEEMQRIYKWYPECK